MHRLLALLLTVLLPCYVLAVPGDLDTSFGGDGWVSTGFEGGSGSGPLRDIVQQADGKLVVAGTSYNGSNNDFALARYNTDGSLDSAFNGVGKLTTAIGTGDDTSWSVIQQNDGKLVAAGYSYNGNKYGFALTRYNLDGSLDTTFDSDGKLTTAMGIYGGFAYSVIQQTDGKLVAAGKSDSNIALARYNLDGSLDATFDGDGKLTTAIFNSSVHANSVIQQADGKLVVAGTCSEGSSSLFALARYNADGSLDATFDGDGLLTIAMGVQDNAYSVIQQLDGKLVVAGSTQNITNFDFALLRINLDGSPDTAFDGDGKLTTSISAGYDYAYSVIQQIDGMLVVAGISSVNKQDVVLVRYNANGSLDAGFDNDGILKTAIGPDNDDAYAVIQQADGKLVVAGNSSGNFAVVRYNVNGTLDAGFNGTGKCITRFFFSLDTGQAVTQQSDGKLVVAGKSRNDSEYDYALSRYNPDGSLDTTFSFDGKLTTDFGKGGSGIQSVMQQADGKLVVAGYSQINGTDIFSLARYNLDGSLDTTFDGDGKLTTAHNFGSAAYSLIQQFDGKLVAAGYGNNGSNSDFALVRYNLDGSLDTTFDGDGKLTTVIGTESSQAYSVIQQSDSKLVAAGHSWNGINYDFTLVRYNLDGSLDSTFSSDGKLTTAFSNGRVKSLIQQTDGKLVAVGHSYNTNNSDFALVRYNLDGSLDFTFDQDGKVTTPIGSGNDEAYSVIQQADGKLVLAGNSANGSNYHFALARYNTDGSSDSSFNDDGILTVAFGTKSYAYTLIKQQDSKLVVAGYATGLPTWQEFVVVRFESGLEDDDGDGLLNNADAFPNDPAEWLDTDSDGTGNNADADDDNDALPDVMDPLPLQAYFNLDGSYKGSTVQDSARVD